LDFLFLITLFSLFVSFHAFNLTERDMFDHRNQQFSTILVAATIMLGALVAVLAQGVLHNDAQHNSYLVIWYSISNSLSMSFLFICDVFCMGVLWRASTFMKKRSRAHFGFLDKAIYKTKDMVRSIRGTMENNGGVPLSHEINNNDTLNSDKNSHAKSNLQSNVEAKRRDISHMRGKQVYSEFSRHEPEVNNYLEQREDIIDESAYIVSADRGLRMENKSFEKFWQESCSFYANLAVLMFYLGSGSLIFANGAFVSSTFFYRYGDKIGGDITFVVIFTTIPLSLTLLIYMRYIERIPMDLDEIEEDEHNWNINGESLNYKINNMKNVLKSKYSNMQSPFQIFRGIMNRMKGYSDISSHATESSTDIYSKSSDQPEIPNYILSSNEIESNDVYQGSNYVNDDDQNWHSRQILYSKISEKNKSIIENENDEGNDGIELILNSNDFGKSSHEMHCLRPNTIEQASTNINGDGIDSASHLNDTNSNSQLIMSNYNNDTEDDFKGPLSNLEFDGSRRRIDSSNGNGCTESTPFRAHEKPIP
jgi:hypothetical protein